MENYIIVILVTAALFLGMILQLAAKPKFAAKVTGTCIVAAGVSGLLIYGYGFAQSSSNLPLAIIRALLAVCGMYVGKLDFSAVSGTALFQSGWAQFFFYLVHLFALYATASAAITTVGGEALQKLRLLLARRGHLHLIYGISPETLDLGKALLAEKHGSVIYVDKAPDSSIVSSITKSGCAVRSDADALSPNSKFLRSIGLRSGSRKVTLYTLSSHVDNLPYAQNFLTAMEAEGISPAQSALVIPLREEGVIHKLQALDSHYGFGFVNAFEESALAARLLTQLYPPCNTISFDDNGTAESNFEALVIGFGQTGQAVLRQLVMNGQFVGSQFRATVVAPDCLTANGYFDHSFSHLLSHYDIRFYDCGAASPRFYQYLREQGAALKYAVVCTGSDKLNREITENLSRTLRNLGVQLPIYLCTKDGVSCCTEDGIFTKPYPIYQPHVLSALQLDRAAMVVNASYQSDSRKSPLEHWMSCPHFDRMSCRASADFLPAMLRAAGKTPAQVLDGDWDLSPAQIETLSHMEHLRWNAFHFCMGYRPMTKAEFEDRAREYLRLQAECPGSRYRIIKNTAARTHAALIDWTALDALSQQENAITGGNRDYRLEDTKNVIAIPALLRSTQEDIQ